MVHRHGLGKVRHQAEGDLWVQHVRSGKIRVSRVSGLEIRVMLKQSTLDQNHYCAVRNRAIGYLSMEGCN